MNRYRFDLAERELAETCMGQGLCDWAYELFKKYDACRGFNSIMKRSELMKQLEDHIKGACTFCTVEAVARRMSR